MKLNQKNLKNIKPNDIKGLLESFPNIKTVFFGATAKDADAIGFRDEIFYGELNIENIKNLQLIECERDECLAAFGEWAAKRDKTMY
jgi:hypothetical protein